MLAEEANEFEMLKRYAWDGEFFWGIAVDALYLRIWRAEIAVDDIDLR